MYMYSCVFIYNVCIMTIIIIMIIIGITTIIIIIIIISSIIIINIIVIIIITITQVAGNQSARRLNDPAMFQEMFRSP